MFSKQLKFTMVTFLLIVFSIVSISVLFSQAEQIAQFKCDNYLTETYTDDEENVITNGCADIPKDECDETDLTLSITESTGCNTPDDYYVCEETTKVLNHGTVKCGWINDACQPTSYSTEGTSFDDCVDEYVGS